LLRLIARTMRIAEKAIHRCYIKENIEYDFCINENGETKKISVIKASTAWKWKSKS